ncbi:MAG: ADP-ribosylglycohydrolase family protein [Micrococcales bacterium]
MPATEPLYRVWLDQTSPGSLDRAVAAAVVAYAAGDAFGFAYEFEAKASAPIPQELRTKGDWPAGGVSDDTLLSLMSIECLSQPAPAAAGKHFLELLHAQQSKLRGLGPTTRHALGLPVKEAEQGIIGVTNGGMMRTALTGLAFSQDEVRRAWVREICAATHFRAEALYCALVMAQLFSTALFGKPDWDVREQLALAIETGPIVPSEFAERAAQHTGKSGPGGVSLNPTETLLAVVDITANSHTVWQAYENAILLGGDTDTLCALAGALVALRNPNSLDELPWLSQVDWQEIPQTGSLIELINRKRSHP